MILDMNTNIHVGIKMNILCNYRHKDTHLKNNMTIEVNLDIDKNMNMTMCVNMNTRFGVNVRISIVISNPYVHR